MAEKKYYQWEGVLWYSDHFNSYEESVEALKEFGVKGYISPPHTDSDKNHLHFIWCFDSSKTYDWVMNAIKEDEILCYSINTVKYVKDLTTRARYLCHLDEKNKPHYSPSDVICMGGTDYNMFLNVSADKYNDDITLMNIIEKYHVKSYAQLVRFCAYCSREHYKSVVGRCGFWSAYVRSLANDPNSQEMEYIIEEIRGKK